MQITIDLPQDLEQDLMTQSVQSNISLQSLILQTLRQSRRSPYNVAQWSDIILNYEGISDFPAFESYREELLPLREPELF
jgi:hypothetical protein